MAAENFTAIAYDIGIFHKLSEDHSFVVPKAQAIPETHTWKQLVLRGTCACRSFFLEREAVVAGDVGEDGGYRVGFQRRGERIQTRLPFLADAEAEPRAAAADDGPRGGAGKRQHL